MSFYFKKVKFAKKGWTFLKDNILLCISAN